MESLRLMSLEYLYLDKQSNHCNDDGCCDSDEDNDDDNDGYSDSEDSYPYIPDSTKLLLWMMVG